MDPFNFPPFFFFFFFFSPFSFESPFVAGEISERDVTVSKGGAKKLVGGALRGGRSYGPACFVGSVCAGGLVESGVWVIDTRKAVVFPS